MLSRIEINGSSFLFFVCLFFCLYYGAFLSHTVLNFICDIRQKNQFFNIIWTNNNNRLIIQYNLPHVKEPASTWEEIQPQAEGVTSYFTPDATPEPG